MPLKLLILPALFLMSSVACFAQFNQLYHTNSTINGNPDSVIITSYTPDGNAGSYKLRKYVTCYNDKGKLINQYDYNYVPMPHIGIDSLPLKSVFVYNDAGELIEDDRYYATGKPWTKEIYTYLPARRIKSEDYYCPDNTLTNTLICMLDRDDKIIEQNDYMKNGQLFTRSYFKYGDNGVQTEEDTYGSDGSLMFKRYYKYDSNKDKVEDSTYYESGIHTIFLYRYSGYDEKHNWSEQIQYSENNHMLFINKRNIIYKR